MAIALMLAWLKRQLSAQICGPDMSLGLLCIFRDTRASFASYRPGADKSFIQRQAPEV